MPGAGLPEGWADLDRGQIDDGGDGRAAFRWALHTIAFVGTVAKSLVETMAVAGEPCPVRIIADVFVWATVAT